MNFLKIKNIPFYERFISNDKNIIDVGIKFKNIPLYGHTLMW